MTGFDQFMQEWLGKRVDYDHVLDFQCVDLIRQGFYEMLDFPAGGGVPRAIDYWRNTPNDVLQRCSRIASTSPQKGDVVILKTFGYTGDAMSDPGDGHIGWATGNQTATQVEILEQNGQTGKGSGTGGDAIRTRYVDKYRIAGLLRPNVVPQAPHTPSDYITYNAQVPTITKRTNKVLTNWWNLSNDSTDIDNFVAVTQLAVNTPFTIGGWAVNAHFPNYRYAMTPDDFGRVQAGNFSTNNGVNSLDLEDIPVAPYIPPSAPVQAKPVEYYNLLTTVTYFDNAEDVKADRNAKGTVEEGRYVLLESDGLARKITKSNMDTDVFWINDYDNKPPYVPPVPSQPVDVVKPTVEPTDVSNNSAPAAKPQYEMIHPIMLRATNTTPMVFPDLEHPNNVVKAQLNPGSVKEYSMVAWVGNDEYYIPTLSMKKGWRHAVPVNYLEKVQKAGFLDYNDDGKVNFSDLSGFIQTPAKIYDTFKPVLTKGNNFLKSNGKQLIDGFTRRKL